MAMSKNKKESLLFDGIGAGKKEATPLAAQEEKMEGQVEFEDTKTFDENVLNAMNAPEQAQEAAKTDELKEVPPVEEKGQEQAQEAVKMATIGALTAAKEETKGVRKQIAIKASTNERFLKYCKDTGMSFNGAINLLMEKYLDGIGY